MGQPDHFTVFIWSLTHGPWGAIEVFLAVSDGLPSALWTELSEGCVEDEFHEDTAGKGETSQEFGSYLFTLRGKRVEIAVLRLPGGSLSERHQRAFRAGEQPNSQL